MTYPSSERVGPILTRVRELAAAAGLDLQVISGGGTGLQEISKTLGCTEARIGSYIWEGKTRVGKRDDLHPQRCPLRMVTTVVSTNVEGQIVIDAAGHANSRMSGNPKLARVIDHLHSEGDTFLRCDGTRRNFGCTAGNSRHDEYIAFREGFVVRSNK